METQSQADLEMLEAALSHGFAEGVRELELRVLEARAGELQRPAPDGEFAAHATAPCALP